MSKYQHIAGISTFMSSSVEHLNKFYNLMARSDKTRLDQVQKSWGLKCSIQILIYYTTRRLSCAFVVCTCVKEVLDLHLSISNGFGSSKIYDKRDDSDFDIVNFPFLDGDVPRRPSYGVYISQRIRFARLCSHVYDFNTRNKCLTAKFLK